MTSMRSGRASLPSRDDTATCPSPGSTVPRARRSPSACLDAIRDYLDASSSNTHGAFAASAETDSAHRGHAVRGRRPARRDRPDEIAFGPNMTTLTFALSRAIGREPRARRRDRRHAHGPRRQRRAMAARSPASATSCVRWVGVDPDDCTLRLDDLDDVLGPRTRLVAVGLASNAVGTINPVRGSPTWSMRSARNCGSTRSTAAPHVPIDVADARRRLPRLLGLQVLRPAPGHPLGPPRAARGTAALSRCDRPERRCPGRFETGTLAHELLAGLARHAAAPGVARRDPGRRPGKAGADDGRRPERLRAALGASRAHELDLVARLIERVGSVSRRPDPRHHRPARASMSAAPRSRSRSTAGTRADVARHLGERGISSGTATTTPGS